MRTAQVTGGNVSINQTSVWLEEDYGANLHFGEIVGTIDIRHNRVDFSVKVGGVSYADGSEEIRESDGDSDSAILRAKNAVVFSIERFLT